MNVRGLCCKVTMEKGRSVCAGFAHFILFQVIPAPGPPQIKQQMDLLLWMCVRPLFECPSLSTPCCLPGGVGGAGVHLFGSQILKLPHKSWNHEFKMSYAFIFTSYTKSYEEYVMQLLSIHVKHQILFTDITVIALKCKMEKTNKKWLYKAVVDWTMLSPWRQVNLNDETSLLA